jgi:hypothetical protein
MISPYVVLAHIFLVWTCALFIAGLLLVVLYSIMTGRIDIQQLILEAGHNVSRFQMLVFTSIFGVTIFLVAISKYPPAFPDVPLGFIYLMAASYGVYFLDKGFELIKGGHGKDADQGPPKND